MSLAPADGRAGARLSDLLQRAPHQFDFFQAIRILGYLARARGTAVPEEEQSAFPEEVVRFRVPPSLGFPASSIAGLEWNSTGDGAPFQVSVAFLGLVGAQGVLPYHYTRLALDRIRARDGSFRDFLDLFHHRLVELFARAWEKYRLPFPFERSQLAPARHRQIDPVSQVLRALVGFGTEGLHGRLDVADGAFVYYGGHFAHYPRSALALEGILAEYFDLPVEVIQLQGQWLYLEPEDCSSMPSPAHPDGRNCQLGVSLMAGARIWDIQSRVRLRLGPLPYSQFRRLLPIGDSLRAVAQLSRTYAGPELDFDVQLVLKAEEVPWCQLGEGSMLGWNTWVRCEEFRNPVDDTIFLIEDRTGLA